MVGINGSVSLLLSEIFLFDSRDIVTAFEQFVKIIFIPYYEGEEVLFHT